MRSNRPGPAAAEPCPCGAPQAYGACCGRFHSREENIHAPTAEALMRSRYSAFVLGLNEYLLDTWHTSTRPARLEFEPERKWLGLEVKRYAQQGEDRATVEFVARSKVGGRAHRLHEVSRFVREDGRWLYVDGDVT